MLVFDFLSMLAFLFFNAETAWSFQIWFLLIDRKNLFNHFVKKLLRNAISALLEADNLPFHCFDPLDFCLGPFVEDFEPIIQMVVVLVLDHKVREFALADLFVD